MSARSEPVDTQPAKSMTRGPWVSLAPRGLDMPCVGLHPAPRDRVPGGPTTGPRGATSPHGPVSVISRTSRIDNGPDKGGLAGQAQLDTPALGGHAAELDVQLAGTPHADGIVHGSLGAWRWVEATHPKADVVGAARRRPARSPEDVLRPVTGLVIHVQRAEVRLRAGAPVPVEDALAVGRNHDEVRVSIAAPGGGELEVARAHADAPGTGLALAADSAAGAAVVVVCVRIHAEVTTDDARRNTGGLLALEASGRVDTHFTFRARVRAQGALVDVRADARRSRAGVARLHLADAATAVSGELVVVV